MYISKQQAQEIKDQLTLHPNYIVICPSPEIAAELETVHGIPEANLKVLACIMVGGKGDIVIMSKRQYSYYSKKELEIINESNHRREQGSA